MVKSLVSIFLITLDHDAIFLHAYPFKVKPFQRTKNEKDQIRSRILPVASIAASSFTSCMTTKTSVGTYRETEANSYTYAKSKQMWLFWGLLPMGRTSTNTPSDGNCQIITKRNFTDVLITGVTGGLLSSYTIKVNAKKTEKPVSVK